ncbi:endonuclease/exonuclease/phosphatase family protein [Pelagicoccus sp. SDUM812003]|uniref:endonuclease/exonuclease/phosphatase family protein n=1 Tax=Pelagicoccus sp. SDUM812003 TaxID=3041267 RepID=UPI00280D429B|nr:endonuclease/exonuclease/phosphatase family protein [Pelagicoccus sp. SDUM812003]MDQ8202628.1 hypothetical protein [Pelagicoccus sp. SDUM812003]
MLKTNSLIRRTLALGSLLLAASSQADTIAYTSFEEASVFSGNYTDTGDAGDDHPLVNNPDQPLVNLTGSNELGFSSAYYNTRNDVGLTDGDFVGVTSYTGEVGSYPDGTNGFEINDPDGVMRLTIDTVDLSSHPETTLSLDLYVSDTGWESNDRIRIWAETESATYDLLDTAGSDIDDLGIEGFWFTLDQDLSGSAWATLRIELDSNSGSENLYVDNIRFTDQAIDGNPGDGDDPEVVFSDSTYTSFEEPATGGKYADPDSATDHQLANNAGQASVYYAGGNEVGFRSFYESTGGEGLSDGDFIGVSSYTGDVGAFPDGSQGYQLSDVDGIVRVELDVIDMALVEAIPTLLVDVYVNSTSWESSDRIKVWVESDLGVAPLLDSTGQDIDDLDIEGRWITLSTDLTGASYAAVKFSLESNAASEGIYIDNIRFGPEPTIPEVTIMDIQGASEISPLIGERIVTEGVVTAVTADRNSFWIQDSDGDGDHRTSDGIFVYSSDIVPETGDLVRLQASVTEYASGSRPTDLPVTELTSAKVEVLSSGNPLPAPIVISDMPNESIPEAIALLESLEGMRVKIPFGLVVASTNRYGEFHIVTGADAQPGSGFSPWYGQMILRPIGDQEVDYNPERILVDDLTLDEPFVVMPGDSFEDLTGVVHYEFSNYRIQPTDTGNATIEQTATEIRPLHWWVAYLKALIDRKHIDVATLNTENLFDLEDNPDKNDQGSTPATEDLETKLDKLAATIGIGLGLPEIVCVQEVENQAVLQLLADRINGKLHHLVDYTAVSLETSDARGIETGFLFDQRRVSLKNHYQISDDIVPGVSEAFGATSASKGREPLVGVFKANGKELTIVNNHFKSKGGDEPLYGANQPAVRESEIQRKLQAQVVRDFADLILEKEKNAYLIVTGDFNDFQFAEPGEGENHTLGIIEGDGTKHPLDNLIVSRIPEYSRFTYVYEGNSQALDHFLVSQKLAKRVAKAEIAHINAAYLDEFMQDASVLERSSDHDPVLVKISLNDTRRFFFR